MPGLAATTSRVLLPRFRAPRQSETADLPKTDWVECLCVFATCFMSRCHSYMTDPEMLVSYRRCLGPGLCFPIMYDCSKWDMVCFWSTVETSEYARNLRKLPSVLRTLSRWANPAAGGQVDGAQRSLTAWSPTYHFTPLQRILSFRCRQDGHKPPCWPCSNLLFLFIKNPQPTYS